jgi:hypothetical protein
MTVPALFIGNRVSFLPGCRITHMGADNFFEKTIDKPMTTCYDKYS